MSGEDWPPLPLIGEAGDISIPPSTIRSVVEKPFMPGSEIYILPSAIILY